MPPKRAVPVVPGVDALREETRSWLAWMAIGGYFIILLLILGTWAWDGRTDDTIKVLTATGSLLSGLVGAVVGFYFRSEKGD